MLDTSPETNSDLHYWAFVSYSSKNERFAKKFHRQLEQFPIPSRLSVENERELPARLSPIFRDREELSASTDLGEAIEAALRESRYLIILCSPAAATSKWVNKEIEFFRSLGREREILAVVIDGEPNASKTSTNKEEECFPPALINNGVNSSAATEPLAADARKDADGFHAALLKVVSRIIGVRYDELAMRDLRARQKRLLFRASAGLVVIVMLAIALILAIHAQARQEEESLKRKFAEGEKNRQIEQRRHEAGSAWLARSTRAIDVERRPLLSAALAQRALGMDSKGKTDKEIQLRPHSSEAAIARNRIARLPARLEREYELNRSHNTEVSALTISDSGELLASGDKSGLVRIWNLHQKSLVAEFAPTRARVTAIDFDDNSHHVIVGDEHNKITLISLSDSKHQRLDLADKRYGRLSITSIQCKSSESWFGVVAKRNGIRSFFYRVKFGEESKFDRVFDSRLFRGDATSWLSKGKGMMVATHGGGQPFVGIIREGEATSEVKSISVSDRILRLHLFESGVSVVGECKPDKTGKKVINLINLAKKTSRVVCSEFRGQLIAVEAKRSQLLGLSSAGTIQIWKFDDPKPQELSGFSGPILCAALVQDYLAIGDASGRVYVLSIDTDDPHLVFRSPGLGGTVKSLANPNSGFAIGATDYGAVLSLDKDGKAQTHRLFDRARTTQTTLSGDGLCAITTHVDGIGWWNLRDDKIIARRNISTFGTSVTTNQSGSLAVITSDMSSNIRILNRSDKNRDHRVSINGMMGPIRFSGNSDTLVFIEGSSRPSFAIDPKDRREGTVTLISPTNGKVFRRVPLGIAKAARMVALSRTVDEEGVIHIEKTGGKEKYRFAGTLSVASKNRLWIYNDMPEQFERVDLRGNGIICDLDVSPNGQWVAVGDDRGCVYIVDASGGSRLELRITNHAISSIRFSKNGDLIRIAEKGGRITDWRLGAFANSVDRFAHSGPLRSGRSKGTRLLGSRKNGKVLRENGENHSLKWPDSVTRIRRFSKIQSVAVGSKQRVAIIDANGRLWLGDVNGPGKPIRSKLPLTTVSLTADEPRLLLATSKGKVLSARSNGESMEELCVTSLPYVEWLQVSPSGSLLWICCSDESPSRSLMDTTPVERIIEIRERTGKLIKTIPLITSTSSFVDRVYNPETSALVLQVREPGTFGRSGMAICTYDLNTGAMETRVHLNEDRHEVIEAMAIRPSDRALAVLSRSVADLVLRFYAMGSKTPFMERRLELRKGELSSASIVNGACFVGDEFCSVTGTYVDIFSKDLQRIGTIRTTLSSISGCWAEGDILYLSGYNGTIGYRISGSDIQSLTSSFSHLKPTHDGVEFKHKQQKELISPQSH